MRNIISGFILSFSFFILPQVIMAGEICITGDSRLTYNDQAYIAEGGFRNVCIMNLSSLERLASDEQYVIAINRTSSQGEYFCKDGQKLLFEINEWKALCRNSRTNEAAKVSKQQREKKRRDKITLLLSQIKNGNK